MTIARVAARATGVFVIVVCLLVFQLPKDCIAQPLCSYTCGSSVHERSVSSCETDCNVTSLCRSAHLALATCEDTTAGTVSVSALAPLLANMSVMPQSCESYLQTFIYGSSNVSTASVCPGSCCGRSLPALGENLEFYAGDYNVTATNAFIAFLPASCGGGQTFGFTDPEISTVKINGTATTAPLMILTNDRTGQVCVYGIPPTS
ncbi:hypothetical protein F1559_001613 [Cyanidiococcus yangmingshanensis]|uniref:Uncharacterized protein n=1 Tax=Cyanidiococcus yangmingshanensis TaxID=2690220 RepID=A0A7J7IIW0_9RHOD|nr:hypothetical protein F1559_001613 [Cyanidiococcus yangmingshanensis]